MILPQRSIVQILIVIFLIVIQKCMPTNYVHSCPIGFRIAYTKYKGDNPICYRMKGPEAFRDKFENCAGNIFTTHLFYTLNITETSKVLWTDYKTLYPGGPFIDWSYTESTGARLDNVRRFSYDPELDVENTCIVIDPIANFTATKCNEKHYRYCFIRPYRTVDDMEQDGCKDFWRFWSPLPTCLRRIKVPYGSIVANWRSARNMCKERGAYLLARGWRYVNSPVFSNPEVPFGVVSIPEKGALRYDASRDEDLIPPSEWNFNDSMDNWPTHITSYGALRDGTWQLVNSSYIFNEVICERPLGLRNVNMTVFVDKEGKLVLSVESFSNETLDDDDFKCYTDSKTYYPTKVKVRYDETNRNYVLSPKTDGYYWCILLNSKDYNITESNKALFIREKQSLAQHYTVEIELNASIGVNVRDIDDYVESWRQKLAEYIFYRTKYVNLFGELEIDPTTSEEVLKEFKASHRTYRYRTDEVVHKIRLKRIIGREMVRLYVELGPEMMPVSPGTWNGITVRYMKPVYYCPGLDGVPTLPLGASTTSSDCRTYTCVGDFNEGVQWVVTAASGCIQQPSPLATTVDFNSEVSMFMPTVQPEESTQSELPYVNDDTSESTEETEDRLPRPTTTISPSTEIVSTVDYETTRIPEIVTTVDLPVTDDIVDVMPTLPTIPATTVPSTPRPPEEQLIQVIEDLETLLQNETVQVADIKDTFDQVDEILESSENVAIPGTLLHLLDLLGSRVDLNGSNQASTIRNNIALLMADAEPEAPVRGLRIAAREEEQFTANAFEIISERVNSTHLAMNKSEAVVQLPESVATSSRRISFVVFRTDRAFQNSHVHYSVNSRVLSINIENITEFERGEVIDIHLSPFNEQIDRNISRACAYWHFLDDDDATGYWSQEGCTFIRSNQEGVLDTCRCDHLTHFAEVLIPRAVFSERNENVLEILTIIGCFMSIFGLCMVAVTAALFRSWRRDFSNKIWLQLCIAIFCLVLCFLIIVYSSFDHYSIPCMLIGVALHYSVLASFCWMLVAAVLSYRRLVIVFTRDASHKLLRASAFSWGVPCAIVGILLSVDPRSYAGQFEEKSPSGAFCYPSGLGLWLAVYAPIALMLLANWTLFALIVRSVFASRRIPRHGDQNEALRCASVSCLLVFLFGLPWIFGLFAQNIVAAYLFTLTATYQGFVLFVFFVLGNKKTRDLWLNKLKIKQTRKIPVTSSTYTNRSTAAGYNRGEPEGAAAIEANSSKPRSLTSTDNARFS